MCCLLCTCYKTFRSSGCNFWDTEFHLFHTHIKTLHTPIWLTRHFTETFCLFLPTGFCCQWSFAAVEVTPWIYILDWLQMLNLMSDSWLFWPQDYHCCISIYLSFSLYTEAYYPIEHRVIGLNTIDCSWSHTSLQLTLKSLPITLKQVQNQTQSPERLAW